MNPQTAMRQRYLLSFLLAVLLLQVVPQAGAQQTGRLFMTQAERLELDRVRQGGVPSVANEGTASRPPAATLTLDGYVQRKGSGKSTVWINSQPQNEQEHPQGITVMTGNGHRGGLSLQLPSGQNVRMKAGQSMDIATGQVREGYESGLLVSDIPPAPVPRGKR